MDHRLLQRVSFWAFLFSIDRDLAATTCQAGCSCGGVCIGPTILESRGAVRKVWPGSTCIG